MAALAVAALALLAPMARPRTVAAAAVVEIGGPAGTTVLVDGLPAGRLPLATPLVLEPGTHWIRCELPGHQPFESELAIADGDARVRLQARLTKLRRREALAYGLVFAGLGQHYVGRPRLGWALSALEAGGLLAGLSGELSFRDRKDDYAVLYAAYRNAITDEEIAARRAAAEAKYAQMEDAQSLRDAGLAVAAGAVVVGLLDAWLRFPSVEAGAGPLPATAATGGAGRADDAPAAVHVGWAARF